MLEAKHLLCNGLKIYDVSEKLAYRDVSYFTKVFRKYWNVTPREMVSSEINFYHQEVRRAEKF
ncbi:AraC family transcriptional regulator [Bacillus sp. N9]